MEFSDIRAIISHAYNLHKGNCFETTRRSFRPSERNLYMLVFSKKENEQFTTLSFLENDSILKSINVQRIDILIDTLGNGSTEINSILFRRSSNSCAEKYFRTSRSRKQPVCKFSANKFSPKVGHQVLNFIRAHTYTPLTSRFSTRSKLGECWRILASC